jgi:hypothetical protein
MLKTKKGPSPHKQNIIYKATIIALWIAVTIVWMLTGCTSQKDGCSSHRGMSGYTNYKK